MKFPSQFITAAFVIFLFSCSPGGTDQAGNDTGSGEAAESAEAGDLLDLNGVPVFQGEYLGEPEDVSFEGDAGDMESLESGASASPVARKGKRVLFSDDFEGFIPENWTVKEEKTGNDVPERVNTSDGMLIIQADITDRNTFFHSKPVKVEPGDIIRINRRAMAEPGNKYAI